MGLIKTKAPSLPIPLPDYSQDQQQQRDSALRLYFNQIDSGNWDGTKIVNAYGAIQDNTDQYASAINTATQVKFGDVDFINWMKHIPNDGLQVAYAGIYNCQFSIQFANTDTQIQEANVWLKKKTNGASSSVDINGTNSKFSIPNNHGGVDGYSVAAVNFYIQLQELDSLELWWDATAAANSGGTVKGIYMEHYAASGHLPSTPSAVLTLSFVSAIP